MMNLVAIVGDTPYRILLLLHILTAMVAFAPAFVHPILASQSNALGDDRQPFLGYMVANGRRIYGPALILTGLFGFGLQGLSDGAWAFGQGWMIGAIVVWIAMNGLLHAVLIPSEAKVADGDEAAQSNVDKSGALLSILLLVMLYLMIFKPGI
ncbi:MAG: hypothetical protein AAF547_14730 [Actinomycetota bacterium]